MSRHLWPYVWADEPLSVDGLYDGGEIFVQSWVKKENKSTQEERNRRREAIGRRYLLGHPPFIQSASLRGPLGLKKGWISPWDNAQLHEEKQRSQGLSKVGDEETHDLGAVLEFESETLRTEADFAYGIEKGDSHAQDDVSMYAAEDDDDDSLALTRKTNRQEHEHPELLMPKAGSRPLYKSDKLQQTHLVESTLSQLLCDINSTNNRDANSLKEDDHPPLTISKKRKADKTWLKSTNVLKRSRHEALEHLSPTPAAGAGRDSGRQAHREFSIQTTGSSTLQKQDFLMSPNFDHASRVIQATSQRFALPELVEGQAGSDSKKVAGMNQHFSRRRDSARPASAEDGVASKSNTSDRRPRVSLPNETNRPVMEARLKSVCMHNQGRRHLDIVEFSPPDLGIDGDAQMTMVCQPRDRDEVEAEIVIDGGVYFNGPSSFQDISKGMISHGISPKSDYCTITSPNAPPSINSEGSFHYRKTKGNRRQESPVIRERQVSQSIEGENDVYSTITHLQVPEKPWSVSVPSINGATANESSVSSNGNVLYEKDYEVSGDWGGSVDSASSVGDEIISVSSPDPLCEDSTVDLQLGAMSSDSAETGQFEELSHGFKDVNNEQQVRISQLILDSSQNPKDIFAPNRVSHARLQRAKTCDASRDITGPSDTSAALKRRQLSDIQRVIESSIQSKPSDDFPQVDQITNECEARTLVDIMSTPNQRRLVEPTTSSRSQSLETEIIAAPGISSKGLQSPWMVVSSQNQLPALARGTGSQDLITGGENGESAIYEKNKTITGFCTSHIEAVVDTKGPLGRHLAALDSPLKHPSKQQDEVKHPLDPIPATQILVEAVTANPWSSAFKKPTKRRSEKRVSFGPLPSETKDDTDSDLPAVPIEPIKSPNPTAAMTSSHGDVKLVSNALTKSVKVNIGQTSATKPQTKPFPSSPSVDAMAEAFINADRHNLGREITSPVCLNPVRLDSNSEDLINTSPGFGGWVAQEDQEHRSSSPLDASFSIAPSGKVTAVSIETQYLKGEDNLDAMIADMGSFFEGWDVDSELKKVKGNLPEKDNDTKGQRKRRYLSGVSNR